MKNVILALALATVVSAAPIVQSAWSNDAHHTKTETKKAKKDKKKSSTKTSTTIDMAANKLIAAAARRT